MTDNNSKLPNLLNCSFLNKQLKMTFKCEARNLGINIIKISVPKIQGGKNIFNSVPAEDPAEFHYHINVLYVNVI